MTVEKLANVINKKKSDPQILPPAILTNTFGNVTKIRDGQLIPAVRLPMNRSTIVDISGGGMQFTGDHKYEKGSLIFCEFSFGKPYEAFVQILDSMGVVDRPGEYRHRAKFFGMNKKEREEIIRYIFALERIKRKHDMNGGDDMSDPT